MFLGERGCLGVDGQTADQRGHILAEIPIDADGAPIVVPVVTRGKSYRLLVDTGAGRTGFDRVHRAALGKPTARLTVQSAAGPMQVEMFRAPVLEIAGLRLRPRDDIGCANLPIADADGRRVDGLLGMDVLGQLVLSLDFDAGRLRIHSGCDSSFGSLVPLFAKRGGDPNCRLARAVLNDGIRGEFLIDTGATIGVSGGLTTSDFESLLRKGELVKIPPIVGDGARKLLSAGGTAVDLQLGRMRRIAIAESVHKDPVFERKANVSFLSLSFLARYSVAFDFPGNKMYLRPRRGLERRDCYDLSGMVVERDRDIFRAAWVWPRSLADSAGLRIGDKIAALDGTSAAQMSLFAARRALCTKGAHVLQIQRGQERHEISLMLSDGPAAGSETEKVGSK